MALTDFGVELETVTKTKIAWTLDGNRWKSGRWEIRKRRGSYRIYVNGSHWRPPTRKGDYGSVKYAKIAVERYMKKASKP